MTASRNPIAWPPIKYTQKFGVQGLLACIRPLIGRAEEAGSSNLPTGNLASLANRPCVQAEPVELGFWNTQHAVFARRIRGLVRMLLGLHSMATRFRSCALKAVAAEARLTASSPAKWAMETWSWPTTRVARGELGGSGRAKVRAGAASCKMARWRRAAPSRVEARVVVLANADGLTLRSARDAACDSPASLGLPQSACTVVIQTNGRVGSLRETSRR